MNAKQQKIKPLHCQLSRTRQRQTSDVSTSSLSSCDPLVPDFGKGSTQVSRSTPVLRGFKLDSSEGIVTSIDPGDKVLLKNFHMVICNSGGMNQSKTLLRIITSPDLMTSGMLHMSPSITEILSPSSNF